MAERQITKEEFEKARQQSIKDIERLLTSMRKTSRELDEHVQTTAIAITFLTLMARIDRLEAKLDHYFNPPKDNLIVPAGMGL